MLASPPRLIYVSKYDWCNRHSFLHLLYFLTTIFLSNFLTNAHIASVPHESHVTC